MTKNPNMCLIEIFTLEWREHENIIKKWNKTRVCQFTEVIHCDHSRNRMERMGGRGLKIERENQKHLK